MFKLFIKRPILSGVISVIIVCLGVLSILTLPITQFPDIVPPSVTVTARYTGASADVMSKTVATPLERAINGVPGMTYMYKPQNKMFHFCKTFCSKITLVNTIQNVILNPI